MAALFGACAAPGAAAAPAEGRADSALLLFFGTRVPALLASRQQDVLHLPYLPTHLPTAPPGAGRPPPDLREGGAGAWVAGCIMAVLLLARSSSAATSCSSLSTW